MKASYNWLKDIVDFNIKPEALANALTMAGLEVEGMSEISNDTVFDINVTPNRPDCLSINGIAREISAILDIPFKSIPGIVQKQEGRKPDVEIKTPQFCERYSARLIRGVKPAISPKWLLDRLETLGFRTSCNIVDITNYVLHEMGQPLHAFDLDKLAGHRIVVKAADQEITFTTLDGEKRIVNKDTLFIWDQDKPVALAGIMGGLDTEVTSSTVNILLESASFNPISIRRTSKLLNITTESSYRFERGVDINNVSEALDRAAQMIAEIAGGNVSALTDIYTDPFKPGQITVSFEKINSLLGIKIEESVIQHILNKLEFKTKKNKDTLSVTPPSFRRDIQSDVDVIEEIARLYGYDKISATLPTITVKPFPVNKIRENIKTIKKSILRSGYTEVINYSFFNPETLDKLNIPNVDKRRKVIFIKNPIRKEEAALRTTLIPSLLSNMNLNLNRGEKTLRFFEISTVFFGSENKLPDEVTQLAAIYNNEISTSFWGKRHDVFYDLKGVFENVLHDLNCNYNDFQLDSSLNQPYLHPGRSCSIKIKNECIGSIGTFHPGILKSFDIKGDISILEIYDINKLIDNISPNITFMPLPKFPYAERDIAVIVSKDITAQEVTEVILDVKSDIVESVKLFDIYSGKQIPEDKKSLAFNIRFRSTDRTLTDKEVDSLQSIIVERLQNTLNATLRS